VRSKQENCVFGAVKANFGGSRKSERLKNVRLISQRRRPVNASTWNDRGDLLLGVAWSPGWRVGGDFAAACFMSVSGRVWTPVGGRRSVNYQSLVGHSRLAGPRSGPMSPWRVVTVEYAWHEGMRSWDWWAVRRGLRLCRTGRV
jgi:hypothetical protein